MRHTRVSFCRGPSCVYSVTVLSASMRTVGKSGNDDFGTDQPSRRGGDDRCGGSLLDREGWLTERVRERKTATTAKSREPTTFAFSPYPTLPPIINPSMTFRNTNGVVHDETWKKIWKKKNYTHTHAITTLVSPAFAKKQKKKKKWRAFARYLRTTSRVPPGRNRLRDLMQNILRRTVFSSKTISVSIVELLI